MNSGSAEILAGEEGLALLLLLLSVEGDSIDRLEEGAISSGAIDDTLKSLQSNASILHYNISNPYIQVERRS